MGSLIRLSWPAKPLWQNRPHHWATKAKAKKSARHEAWAMAREAGVQADPGARLEFHFHPPDRRRRDLHNMPATQKAAIDGIADAMGCDDNAFQCVWPVQFSQPVKGGCVVVRVSSNPERSEI